MRAYFLLPAIALSAPAIALAEPPAAPEQAALPPRAEQCAECEKRAQPAAPEVDTARRDGGIALAVLGSLGIAGGVAQIIAGEVMTDLSCGEGEDCLITDARSLTISGAVTVGLGASLLPFGIVLLATDAWKDEAPKAAAAGQPFAIDERPRAIAPRYWLGEF